ncbi:hypothetical protein AXG93_107s1270 [Marchantia polymorpha subsp. ruderalis]|uniref:Malectin-like domain-containing protein n=1 Tax=Marchantia polymorpha subsp. ruderalis TaxID=1480154 RepID=A0A176WIP5_MARPO|nr:hypothetical protein AXG93_107s1270 [Marchantia polymorpha subsp. ruderalis]
MLVDHFDLGGILDTESPSFRCTCVWELKKSGARLALPHNAVQHVKCMVTIDVLLHGKGHCFIPEDPFDRIWTSPRIPKGAQFEAYNSSEDAKLGFGGTNVRFPIGNMRLIWRGKNVSSTIDFEVYVKSARALRPLPTFWFQMLCSNVVSGAVNPYQPVSLIDGDQAWVYSPFEVPGSPGYRATTRKVYPNFASSSVDTAGDPCLPVLWDWLLCSIELPPTNKSYYESRVGRVRPGSIIAEWDFSRINSSGQIPPFPADSFMNLEYIPFCQNQLVGKLSYLIRSLTQSVKGINLRDNAFIGPIPAENMKLENLESLNLSGNNLSQGLPTELGKSQSLKTLNMESNNFTELNLTTWY